jgi:hypothetical protein
MVKSVMHVEAKINSVQHSDADPFISITVTLQPDITEYQPDHLEMTWTHFLDLLRNNLKPYLQSCCGSLDFPEVWQAVNALRHPLVGRLFPTPEQCLTRKQLIRDYGCSLSDIRQLPSIEGRRYGRRRICLYDPEHPEVRALIGIPHDELHGDHGDYDE